MALRSEDAESCGPPEIPNIALMFVRVAPSLQLGQTHCHDAILQIEQYDTPHESNLARTHSALLLKILEWYRALAMHPGKRDRVYRYASNAEAAALSAVCGLVDRTVAMYPGKKEIVFLNASRPEVSARNAVCDLVVRGDDSEPSTTGAAQPFSRT